MLMVLKWTPNESGQIFQSIATGPKAQVLSLERCWVKCTRDTAGSPQWPRLSEVDFKTSSLVLVLLDSHLWSWQLPLFPIHEVTFVQHSLRIRYSHLILIVTSVARLLVSVYRIGQGGLLPKDTHLIRGRGEIKTHVCLNLKPTRSPIIMVRSGS